MAPETEATDSKKRGRPRTVSDEDIIRAIQANTLNSNSHPVTTTEEITDTLHKFTADEDDGGITERGARKRLQALAERSPCPIDRKMVGGVSAWYLTDYGVEYLENGDAYPDLSDHFNGRGDHKREEYGKKWVLAPPTVFDQAPPW